MSQTTYYKIIHGFGVEDYIEIEASELQKAFYCFLEKKDAIFSGGAIRGANIHEIKPDYHRTMGWVRGYKLTGRDFEDMNGIDRKLQHFLAKTKDVVQHLISTNQLQLIGKAEVNLTNHPQVGGGGMKQIGEITNGQGKNTN